MAIKIRALFLLLFTKTIKYQNFFNAFARSGFSARAGFFNFGENAFSLRFALWRFFLLYGCSFGGLGYAVSSSLVSHSLTIFSVKASLKTKKFSHFSEEHRDVTRICLPNDKKSYIIMNGIQRIIEKGYPFSSVGTYGRFPLLN